MRVVRGLGLTMIGAFAGLAAAAAFVKRAVPSRGDEESEEVALVAVFDGIELRSRANAFRGGSMLAWYGGVEVDLSEATLAPDVHLSIHSLLGGIAIRVPSGCRIESNMKAVVGGVAVAPTEPEGEVASTVTLDGLAILGGIAVGRQRTSAAGSDDDV